jgi:hypothetical protein
MVTIADHRSSFNEQPPVDHQYCPEVVPQVGNATGGVDQEVLHVLILQQGELKITLLR